MALIICRFEPSKPALDYWKESPSLPISSFICFLSLSTHQAGCKINISHLHLSFVTLYLHRSFYIWLKVTFFSWLLISPTAECVSAESRLTTNLSRRMVARPSDAAYKCLRSSPQPRIALPSPKSYYTRKQKLGSFMTDRLGVSITFIHTHTSPPASPFACHSTQI